MTGALPDDDEQAAARLAKSVEQTATYLRRQMASNDPRERNSAAQALEGLALAQFHASRVHGARRLG